MSYIKNKTGFSPLYSIATDGDGTFIAYFFNRSVFTGYLNGLENGSIYHFCWYNPRTNEYTDAGSLTFNGGRYKIPQKPDGGDWVFIAEKA